MKPWINFAHMPIYLLLLVAAAACFVALSEIRRRPGAVLGPGTSPTSLFTGVIASVAFVLVFFVLLIAIGLFVGVGFGPFYLLLGVALIMFVIIPAMAIPPLGRRLDTVTPRQAVVASAAVVTVCIVVSFLYLVGARSFGIVIRFAEAQPM